MVMLPKKLQQKIIQRQKDNTLRQFGSQNNLVDFSSNDYLGFAKSDIIFKAAHQALIDQNIIQNGSTGSRLLTGNNNLFSVLESQLCEFHSCESALIFNSGYDANLGLFSSIPQRNDIILYDEYIHASIRDGIQLSHARSIKFRHNDLNDIAEKLKNHKGETVYVVTESIFSMDGDSPDLKTLVEICTANQAYLIVDEAHAIGVCNKNGSGLIQQLGLEHSIFARLVTFGKAVGVHGAAILGSEQLKTYLINFARSFIYTTALSPHTLATIQSAYSELSQTSEIEKLRLNISFCNSEIKRLQLQDAFIESNSAIHCCLISGNIKVKQVAEQLKMKGFGVKPILSPTIPKGEERLRLCLHSFNSEKEISEVLQLLATFVL